MFLGNAFKYTLEGTITVKVEFGPSWASFSVRDTGVGVPPEDLDKSVYFDGSVVLF